MVNRVVRWMAVVAAMVVAISHECIAQTNQRPSDVFLWQEGAPGFESRKNEKEIEDVAPGKCNVTNIHNPSVVPFLPSSDKRTGTAILIAPGGGHRMLCMGHEGYSLGEWLAKRGIAAFVLKYRLAREEASVYSVDEHAMADTRRALRLIRSRASEWGIDADKIGVLGFSAGGELAALLAMKHDEGNANASDLVERVSCRPNFQVLIYPGSSKRFKVEKGMPPVFIALGYNDREDISVGMAEIYLQYKRQGIPAELHIYSSAGHGFGFRPEAKSGAGDWPIRMEEWLRDSKLLTIPTRG